MIRVLCVDDEPSILRLLANWLAQEPDVQVCGQAEGLTEAEVFLRSSDCDVVVLDYWLRDGTGLELLERCPGMAARVLMLSGRVDLELEAQARLVGIAGAVPKSRLDRELIPALRVVAQGGVWFYEATRELFRGECGPFGGAARTVSHLDPVLQ